MTSEHRGSAGGAVLVHIGISEEWGSTLDRIKLGFLELRLRTAVRRRRVGELDGRLLGAGEVVFYLYGPDEHRLWHAVEPVLRRSSLRPAHALVREGGPEVEPERIDL